LILLRETTTVGKNTSVAIPYPVTVIVQVTSPS
jgi:hypothetical protein